MEYERVELPKDSTDMSKINNMANEGWVVKNTLVSGENIVYIMERSKKQIL